MIDLVDETVALHFNLEEMCDALGYVYVIYEVERVNAINYMQFYVLFTFPSPTISLQCNN
jgi:hypothetical protein